MPRILIVEPYFGGSHKQFLVGLQKYITAEFEFLTLPARKWKMRMQLSAPWFAMCVKKMNNKHFDTVLCSTFVDVSVLKSLLLSIEQWNDKCLFCTYFHENQFVYPEQLKHTSTHQFTSINFTTALVSDRLAFNSIYNLKTFFESSSRYIKKAADIELYPLLEEIEAKSTILYPGLDFSDFSNNIKNENKPPVIVWNHRWEHDKNPNAFFEAMMALDDKRYEFKLIVLGQSFRKIPEIFNIARAKLRHKIEHFGFVKSRSDYITLLQKGDIVVSTAKHEFFGIAIVEAVRAGCYPIVPARLSYPELYPKKCLYKDGKLIDKLTELLDDLHLLRNSKSPIDADIFSWEKQRFKYREWLTKRYE